MSWNKEEQPLFKGKVLYRNILHVQVDMGLKISSENFLFSFKIVFAHLDSFTPKVHINLYFEWTWVPLYVQRSAPKHEVVQIHE